MFFFSKSKYCDFVQCPKIPWLKKYKPEEYSVDAATQARFTAGNEVGDLAMGLFGEFSEVTSFKADGSLDLNKMKALTRQYLQEGREVVCEASFDYRGLYCAVDILKKSGGGYDIYEVKSSTSPDHDVYIVDTSYQRYVLERCGVRVEKVYLVTVNSAYVYDGTLDLSGLFTVTDVSGRVEEEMGKVEGTLKEAQDVMALREEPEIDISERCNAPYPCAFFGYCTRHLPKPNVFDLYRFDYKKKLALYREGLVSYRDILENVPLEGIRLRQVEYALEERGVHFDREGISVFLQTLSFPLCFLDFETVQPVIPRYIGTRPYQQIPVQYSLHILREGGGTLEHREFLGRSEEDPRRALAERLVADIPEGACVLAYNKSFECTRIKELAEAFPDLKDRLLAIKESIKDLLDPFQKGYCYTREMGGSFSVKSVLPALYPNDPSLDYHNLEDVHNGSEAMELFPKLKDMGKEERERAEQNLLKYCELDTFAMVKVYEALRKLS